MPIDLFPYDTRPHQEQMLQTVRSILSEHGENHLILESPTGSGKTICALVPAVEDSLENGRRIIYTTRTNSQQHQVMKELRRIVHRAQRPFFGIGIQGRGNMCLMIRSDPEMQKGNPEELSVICGDLKRYSQSKNPDRGCPFYSGLLASDLDEIRGWVKAELPTNEELIIYCDKRGICPYELSKRLMPEANLIIAPYIFVFHPQISLRLMDWSKMTPENVILIVDEAHNLPEFIRELRSMELGQVTLKRAISEAKDFGDPSLANDTKATTFLRTLEKILLDLETEYIIDDDGLIPPDDLSIELMTRLKMTSQRLEGMLKEVMVHGEIIKESRRKNGKLPRSYMGRVASFLAQWSSLQDEAHVRLIKRERTQVFLEAYCMDPTVAGDILCTLAKTIHISGTLSPLEEYRDSVGLPSTTKIESLPSPFPKENLLLLYTDQLTTKFETLRHDDAMNDRIARVIIEMCKKVSFNCAIFFPSFQFMRNMNSKGLSKDLKDLGRRVFVEVQGDQSVLMEMVRSFKAASNDPECNGAILMTVAGGRVSEGMDFPEKELEMTILVGIPYPKPTSKIKALTYFYDMKFGKGWDYIVKAPTERKILQTIGRLVRSETDIGAAVILDYRAVHFSDRIPRLELENDPSTRIKEFFENRGFGKTI